MNQTPAELPTPAEDAHWVKSSFSFSNGNCTEVAARHGAVLVRDSKLGEESPVLSFAPEAWQRFLAGVKSS
jgi:hypothetical protein